MTKETKKHVKLATILWFGVTAALLGFATIYIALRLTGNLSAPDHNATKAPNAIAKPTKPVNKAKTHDTLATVHSADNIKNLPNNTTEVSKVSGLKGYNKGEVAAFLVRSKALDIPDFGFVPLSGKVTSLQQWQGKVILLNIWATWCIPCRKEMPDLDKLQGLLGSQDFEVVTVNIDKGGLKKPSLFFNKLGIKNLTLYGAQSNRLTTLLKAPGLPLTILVSKHGKELGRLIGPAQWSSPDAIQLIKAAIALP